MAKQRTYCINRSILEQLTKKAGLTQEKLSSKTGLSINTVRKAFSGKPMLMSSCIQIAKFLNTTVDVIIDDTGTSPLPESVEPLSAPVPSLAEADHYNIAIGLNYFRNNQFAQAIHIFTALAENESDIVAMNHLGWIYQHGLGQPMDAVKAAYWYRRAAELGSVNGQSNFGWMCENGIGVPQNYHAALDWYRRAAAGGDGLAMNQLGWMYQQGLGVPTDLPEAFLWYKRSAETGNRNGLGNLGWSYHYGLGTKKDLSLAANYYRQAIEAGNTDSRANLDLLLTELEKTLDRTTPPSA